MCNYCIPHNIFDKDGNRIRGKTNKEIAAYEDSFDTPRGNAGATHGGSPHRKEDPGFDHNDPRL